MTTTYDQFTERVAALEEAYEIPQKVIDLYKTLDKTKPMTTLPPIGFAASLLQLIEQQATASLLTTRFTLAVANRDQEAANTLLIDIGEMSINLQNQSRRLLHLHMAEAIEQELGEGALDGE